MENISVERMCYHKIQYQHCVYDTTILIIINSLTGIINFENSWKNMDTMDRIPRPQKDVCTESAVLIELKQYKMT